MYYVVTNTVEGLLCGTLREATETTSPAEHVKMVFAHIWMVNFQLFEIIWVIKILQNVF